MNSLFEALGKADQYFNSLTGAASTAMNIYDKRNKQVADAELRSMNVDLNSFMNEELDKFSKRNDFENFENEWQHDFMDEYNKYNSTSGDMAYKNNYTMKMGNEMFNQIKAQGSAAIGQMVDKRKLMYANEKDASTIEKINTSQPAGQERFNSVKGILDIELSEGRTDEATYKANLQQQLDQTEFEMTLDKADKWLEENPDATQADFNEMLNNLTVDDIDAEISGHGEGLEGYSLTNNNEAINSAAKKQINQKVIQMQDNNNNSIYATNTDILQNCALGTKPLNDLLDDLVTQINYINSVPSLQLNESDRRSRLKELEGLYKDLSKLAEIPAPKITTGGTGGKGGKPKSKEYETKKKSYESTIKDNLDRFVQAAWNGVGVGSEPGIDSIYAAHDAFMETVYDLYEGEGLSKNQADLDWSQNFIDACVRKIENNPAYSRIRPVLDNIKNMVGEYEDKGSSEYNLLCEDLMEYTWDLVFDTNYRDMDPHELQQNVQEMLDSLRAKEFTIEYYKKDNRDEMISGATKQFQEHDILWTDRVDQPMMSNKAQELLYDQDNGLIVNQKEALAIAGVNIKNMQLSHMTKSGHDENVDPTYYDSEGHEYRFRNVEEEVKEKGLDKNIKYAIYKDGKQWKTNVDIANEEKNNKDAAEQAKEEVKWNSKYEQFVQDRTYDYLDEMYGKDNYTEEQKQQAYDLIKGGWDKELGKRNSVKELLDIYNSKQSSMDQQMKDYVNSQKQNDNKMQQSAAASEKARKEAAEREAREKERAEQDKKTKADKEAKAKEKAEEFKKKKAEEDNEKRILASKVPSGISGSQWAAMTENQKRKYLKDKNIEKEYFGK